MKVEILTEGSSDKLKTKLQDWIDNSPENTTIHNISFSTSEDENNTTFSVLFLYSKFNMFENGQTDPIF